MNFFFYIELNNHIKEHYDGTRGDEQVILCAMLTLTIEKVSRLAAHVQCEKKTMDVRKSCDKFNRQSIELDFFIGFLN